MALKDLKSDLSKFRKPFKQDSIEKQSKSKTVDKNFTTTPLSERMIPNVDNVQQSTQKQGVDVNKDTTPSGRHTEGTDVSKDITPTGRHTEGQDVTSDSKLSGRHEKGVDVDNESSVSGRHNTGVEVRNDVPIDGRHTEGKDVANNSDISGRHTQGKDVANNSDISGRHETDNSTFNIDGPVPPTNPIGRHDSGDTSNFNVDGNPIPTNPRDRHDQGDTSNFNIDGVVPLTNPRDRHDSGDTSNFNIDGPVPITQAGGRHEVPNHQAGHSVHDIDGVVSPTNPAGRHDAGDTSNFNIDGNVGKYTDTLQPYGLHGNAHNSNHSGQDVDGNISITNPEGRHFPNPSVGVQTPNPVNFILDLHANGFTSNLAPGINTSVYGEFNMGSSILGMTGPFNVNQPTAVNYFGNQDAVGFTLNEQAGNDTRFRGIFGAPGNLEFHRPDVVNSQLGTVNYFNALGGDNLAGAKGFTLRQGDLPSDQQTQFNGVQSFGPNLNSFIYPNAVNGGRMWNVRGWKLHRQLGGGTIVPGTSKLGIPGIKKLEKSELGYHAGRTYSEANSLVGLDTKLSPLGFQYTKQNSPSFLDELYSKFNLREDSTNYTYMKHPLILRGIQRKGKKGFDPQRWGTDTKFGFDDGLIRGGALTAIERAAVDTARIAKFMASPKGLLWVGKQVGLGLSNSLVETAPGSSLKGIAQTRTHSGLASLLSVGAGTFGSHFTRHGIPLANELASYGNVQKTKLTIDNTGGNNRLIALKKELMNDYNTGEGGVLGTIQQVSNTLKGFGGQVIQELSGLGGPGSVYGVGATTIRRHTDTYTGRINDEQTTYTPKNITQQYASALNPKSTTYDDDTLNRTVNNDTEDEKNLEYQDGLKGQHESKLDNGASVYPINPQTTVANPLAQPKSIAGATSIESYRTNAYMDLKRDDDKIGTSTPQDFREKIFAEGDVDSVKHMTNPLNENSGDVLNYKDNNLTTKYGFGEHGKVGVDRTDPTKTYYKTSRGDKVNLLNAAVLKGKIKGKENIYDRSDDGISTTDLVPFYFSGPREINEVEEEVLVFRALLGNFSDQYNPSWNSYPLIGRADPVYVYNSWARNVTFDFDVAATSRDEMRPIWRKLNYLGSWTAPKYGINGKGSGKMVGPMIRFTLGSLFQETPCFINSLTYSVDNTNTTWETGNVDNDQLILPKHVKVSMGLTMIMDYRPQWDGRMYSLSSNGSTKGSAQRQRNTTNELQWLPDTSAQTNKSDIIKDNTPNRNVLND